MEANQLHAIAAETAALASKAIKESGHSLAEVSRRTLIPYVSLHRKVHGATALTVTDVASISLAISRPFADLLPQVPTKGN